MTDKERAEAREAKAQDLRNRLVTEYHELTHKIVVAEARSHEVCANRYTSTRERQINDELIKQVDCMRGYRNHLMRRMAMLGIDLKKVVD